jgi:hypothetical protein
MSDENRPSLTYPAVLAGAVAAATATVLSTRLGLVGTVVGAVVASVVSTLVSTVFVRGLERTHDRVTTARDAGPRVQQRDAAVPRIGHHDGDPRSATRHPLQLLARRPGRAHHRDLERA